MSELIPGSPLGSLCSGEVFSQLCTDKRIVLYIYTHHGLVRKTELFMNNKGKVYIKPKESDVLQPYDLGGLLHIMNHPDWRCVVFTNYWFARAYEESVKQDITPPVEERVCA